MPPVIVLALLTLLPAAEAQPQLALPRPEADARVTVAGPWDYARSGIYEKRSGRWVAPLPLDFAEALYPASPWILATHEHTVAQIQGLDVLRQFSFAYNSQPSRYPPHMAFHTPWLVSAHSVPRLKYLAPDGSTVHQREILDYDPEWKLHTQAQHIELRADDQPVHTFLLPHLQPVQGEHVDNYDFPELPSTQPNQAFSAGQLAAPIHLEGGSSVVLGLDQVFHFYDLRSGARVAERTFPGGPISAWVMQGEQLILARTDTRQPHLERWNWRTHQRLQVWNGFHSPLEHLYQQGTLLLGLTADALCSFDLTQGKIVECRPRQTGRVHKLDSEAPLSLTLIHAQQETQLITLQSDGKIRIQNPPPPPLKMATYQPGSPLPLSAIAPVPAHTAWFQAQTARLMYQRGNTVSIWDLKTHHTQVFQPCATLCEAAILDWQDQTVLLHIAYPEFSDFGGSAGAVAGTPQADQREDYIEVNLTTGAQTLLHQDRSFAITHHPHCVYPDRLVISQNTPGRFASIPRQFVTRSARYQKNAWRASYDKELVCGLDGTLFRGWNSLRAGPGASEHELRPHRPEHPVWAWLDQRATVTAPLPLPDRLLAATPERFIFAAESYPGYLREQRGATFSALHLPSGAIRPEQCRQTGTDLVCHTQTPQYEQIYHLALKAPLLAWGPWHHSPAAARAVPLYASPQAPPSHSANQPQNSPLPSARYTLFAHNQRQVLLYLDAHGPLWVTDQGHYWRHKADAPAPYQVTAGTSLSLPSQWQQPEEIRRALAGQPALKPTGQQFDLTRDVL